MKKNNLAHKTTLFLSVLFLIFFVYKEVNANDDLKGYYITHAYFFLLLIVILLIITFVAKKVQTYFFILFFSFVLSLYLFEGYIFYAGKIKFFQSARDYEQNLKIALQDEIKKHKDGIAPFSVNNNDLISFSGISNSKMILCNEGGFFASYTSDRNGFNNPDYVWDKDIVDVVIMGDSFVHGICVNEGNDISSYVRSLSKLNTINIGWQKTGPLRQYATFLEYIKKNPRYIFWVYYGNDLVDLKNELKNDLLLKYYLNEKFKQNLNKKRDKIDYLLEKEHEKFMHTSFELNKVKRYTNLVHFLKVYKTRQLLFSNLSNFLNLENTINYNLNDDKTLTIYFKLIDKMKKITNEKDTKLVLVYLPTDKYEFSKRSDKLKNVKKKIFKNMKEKNIDVIDIEGLIKENFLFPNVLYPKLSTGNHFNERGYKFIANKIVDFIKENEEK